jgi:hypothetical protein
MSVKKYGSANGDGSPAPHVQQKRELAPIVLAMA